MHLCGWMAKVSLKFMEISKKKTHFKSDMSLSKKFMILDVKMKLEKTVNKPAIPIYACVIVKEKINVIHFFLLHCSTQTAFLSLSVICVLIVVLVVKKWVSIHIRPSYQQFIYL